MRFRFLFLLVGITTFILNACGSQNNALIALAPDRLTFLFFYTDD